MKNITVVYQGNSLLVNTEVAEAMKLKNGQQIQEESDFWEILRTNALFNLIEINRMKSKKDEPQATPPATPTSQTTDNQL